MPLDFRCFAILSQGTFNLLSKAVELKAFADNFAMMVLVGLFFID